MEQQAENKLTSYINLVVPWKLQELENSYRSMLQDLKGEVANVTCSLQTEVHRIKEQMNCHFDEMRRTVRTFLDGVKNVRKQLPKAIFRILDMCDGDLDRLVQKTEFIRMKLGDVRKQLDTQELAVTGSFQKCVSSIHNRWTPS
jgi:hypothetical protein